MLKIGNKRRRTKAQIEEDKEEEIRQQEKLASELEELADLRGRIRAAEDQVI